MYKHGYTLSQQEYPSQGLREYPGKLEDRFIPGIVGGLAEEMCHLMLNWGLGSEIDRDLMLNSSPQVM